MWRWVLHRRCHMSHSLTATLFESSGCQQNYHKRCVVKVPNNCSRIDVTKNSRSNHLQTPRSPSGGSNHSGTEDQQSLLTGSGSSLVRKMQQLMNEISNWEWKWRSGDYFCLQAWLIKVFGSGYSKFCCDYIVGSLILRSLHLQESQ